MHAFTWSPRFETGIPVVDQQHRQLVAIVNRLGEQLIRGQVPAGGLEGLLGELAGYAQRHFADEERLMAEGALHPDHADEHRRHHQAFVAQVARLWQGREALERPEEVLHGFLTSWLATHILEEDQAMARQLRLRAGGVAAAEALAQTRREVDNGTAVLLQAMRQLHQVLAKQNEALALANRRLEAQVEARTRSLLAAERLAAVGQVAAGVAHELNGPVGCLNSNLSTLRLYAGQLLGLVEAAEASLAPHPDAAADLARAAAAVDLAYLRQDLPELLQESQEELDRMRRIVQSLQGAIHQHGGRLDG